VDQVLAIDVGTQFLKAAVFDSNLAMLDRQQVSYTPVVKAGKWVEIEAQVLWNAFPEACKKLRKAKEVKAISFSTLCPSLVPIDADGNSLSPMILHLDRRSYPQAVWALARVGQDKFLRTAGNLPFPGGISLTSLLWIKENKPSIYSQKNAIFGHAVNFL
jgi:sugar (pentulose or hexulose) kinase